MYRGYTGWILTIHLLCILLYVILLIHTKYSLRIRALNLLLIKVLLNSYGTLIKLRFYTDKINNVNCKCSS
jgi:hypothetical protein